MVFNMKIQWTSDILQLPWILADIVDMSLLQGGQIYTVRTTLYLLC